MAEVYRADDLILGLSVALKFLAPTLAQDPEGLRRLLAEARIGREVSHPNCSKLFDVVEIGDSYCVAMEFVDGEDLRTLLTRIGHLPVEKSISIAREICAGLAAAHDKGVLHRDLKPANVMIDGAGHARITDFGIAAFVEDAQHDVGTGTPAYMAPEQLDGSPATVRTDIYALGVLLYELFSGRRPFDGRSREELRSNQRLGADSLTITQRDIPAAVDAIILRCLDPHPEERPANAREVLAALPGRSELDAALAEGETPSPAMVAAAGHAGRLRPGLAFGLAVAFIVASVAAAYAHRSATLVGVIGMPKSHAVLMDRAQELAKQMGFDGLRVDDVGWFAWEESFVRWAESESPDAAQVTRFATSQPTPLVFVYRQSPTPLQPLISATGRIAPGRVTADNPPFDEPGMVRITLDPRGRLLRFEAVPHPSRGGIGTPELDTVLIRATGVEVAASADDPASTTFVGHHPDRPHAPVEFHLSEDTHRFALSRPWERASDGGAIAPASGRAPDEARVELAGSEDDYPLARRIVVLVSITAFIAVLAALFIKVLRNVRARRGDLGGAIRLGVVVYALSVATALLPAHYGTPQAFADAFGIANVVGLGTALLTASFYVALEPYARRRWPHALIAWTRLLRGQLRDPMVGRDVLVGAASGAVAAAVYFALSTIGPDAEPLATSARIPGRIRDRLAGFGGELQFSIRFVLMFAFLLTAVVRARFLVRWSAYALIAMTIASLVSATHSTLADTHSNWLASMVAAVATLAIIVRSGVLAGIMCLFVSRLLLDSPLSLGGADLQGPATFLILATLSGLAVAAAVTASGRRLGAI